MIMACKFSKQLTCNDAVHVMSLHGIEENVRDANHDKTKQNCHHTSPHVTSDHPTQKCYRQ